MIYFPKGVQTLKFGLNIVHVYNKRLWVHLLIPLPLFIINKYNDFFENYQGWRILTLKLSFYRSYGIPDRINISCKLYPLGKQKILNETLYSKKST